MPKKACYLCSGKETAKCMTCSRHYEDLFSPNDDYFDMDFEERIHGGCCTCKYWGEGKKCPANPFAVAPCSRWRADPEKMKKLRDDWYNRKEKKDGCCS